MNLMWNTQNGNSWEGTMCCQKLPQDGKDFYVFNFGPTGGSGRATKHASLVEALKENLLCKELEHPMVDWNDNEIVNLSRFLRECSNMALSECESFTKLLQRLIQDNSQQASQSTGITRLKLKYIGIALSVTLEHVKSITPKANLLSMEF